MATDYIYHIIKLEAWQYSADHLQPLTAISRLAKPPFGYTEQPCS